MLEEKVERLEGNEKVERAVTTGGTLDADLVIVAVGAEPNSDLARMAGLDVSPRGAIVVNSKMQTSDPDIYAGGDCVEVTNLITGKPGYYPLGSMANRQGRIIGTNLAGGNAQRQEACADLQHRRAFLRSSGDIGRNGHKGKL